MNEHATALTIGEAVSAVSTGGIDELLTGLVVGCGLLAVAVLLVCLGECRVCCRAFLLHLLPRLALSPPLLGPAAHSPMRSAVDGGPLSSRAYRSTYQIPLRLFRCGAERTKGGSARRGVMFAHAGIVRTSCPYVLICLSPREGLA